MIQCSLLPFPTYWIFSLVECAVLAYYLQLSSLHHIQKVTKAFVRSFVRVFVRVFVPKIVEQFSSGAETAAQRMR